MVVSSVSGDLAQSIELVRRKFTKRLSDVDASSNSFRRTKLRYCALGSTHRDDCVRECDGGERDHERRPACMLQARHDEDAVQDERRGAESAPKDPSSIEKSRGVRRHPGTISAEDSSSQRKGRSTSQWLDPKHGLWRTRRRTSESDASRR